MANETISWDLLARDHASRQFRDVGDSAAAAGAKMDFAAASLKTFNDSTQKAGKAAATSEQAFKTHAKAATLLSDAYRVLDGKSTEFTKLTVDQIQKMDQAGKSSVTLKSRLAALTGAGAGTGLGGTGMAALVGAGVALSGQITTLAFGFGGLGLAAAGLVKPIEKAAQSSGGLAANLHKLDPEQKKVAYGLLGLGHQYDAFQKSLEPQVLTAFNDGFRIAGHLLHDIQPIAKNTGDALHQVLDSVDKEFQSGTWQQFFGFMAREAGPDTRQLGQLFTDLLDTIPPLVQDLHPLGQGLITVADDFTKAVHGATSFYDSFQKNVPISNQHTSNFLKDLDRDVVSLTNHIPGAHAVNDWLTNIQHTLTGTGGAAQQSVPEIQHAAQAVSDMMKTTVTTVTPVDRLGKATQSTSFSISEYGKNANLTVTPTDRLGRVADVSAAHIGHVATAADFASQKVIDVRHSVQDLTTALSKGLDPLLHYSGGLLTQKDDAKNLADALKASGDKIGFQTQKQRDSFSAANTYIGDLENTAKNALASHQGIDKQITSLQNALPALEHAQSHSKLYWQEVRTLIAYLDKLRRERAIRESVTVFGAGTWSLSQPGGKLAGPLGTAQGALISGGTAGKDSVPIMAMPGELVVPTKMVQSGAVDHLRGSIPGFAAGGFVPGYRGSVAGLPPWISSNQAASVHAVTADIARAFAAQFKSMFAAGFGTPGPGGGAPAANAALARRMMPAWGNGAEWAAWNYVAMRESGWSQFARNPSSGAYGIPQALPPGKMGAAANPPQSNPAAQISWMIGYIRGRYGDPIGAAAHERAFNWYDRGGWLKPGLTMAYNGTGRPEQVLPPGRSGGGTTVINNVTVQVGHGTHPVAAAQELAKVLNQGAHLGGVKLRSSILGPG